MSIINTVFISSLQEMMVSNDFSDVVLAVKQGQHAHFARCHRLILAAWSPFLAALLTEDNIVWLPNVALTELQSLIKLLYTGETAVKDIQSFIELLKMLEIDVQADNFVLGNHHDKGDERLCCDNNNNDRGSKEDVGKMCEDPSNVEPKMAVSDASLLLPSINLDSSTSNIKELNASKNGNDDFSSKSVMESPMISDLFTLDPSDLDYSQMFLFELNDNLSSLSSVSNDSLMTDSPQSEFQQNAISAPTLVTSSPTFAPTFSCPSCLRVFSARRSLLEHFRTHTGEKPYQCCKCNRSFALKKTLRVHMRQHTGERPYLCSFCGKTFVQNATLKNHLKHCHN